MARIIAVVNQKGGSGKTTATVNIAGGLSNLYGLNVLVVDADKQASATEWRNRSEESLMPFSIMSMAHQNIHLELPKHLKNSNYDVALIDSPPGGAWSDDVISLSAVLAADVVIIPMKPSPMDFLIASQLAGVISRAMTLKPNLQVFLLINMKPTGRELLAKEGKEAALSLFQEAPFPVSVFDTEIGNRTVFAQCVGLGQTVVDFAPHSKAAAEVLALTKEVKEKCLSESLQASSAM